MKKQEELKWNVFIIRECPLRLRASCVERDCAENVLREIRRGFVIAVQLRYCKMKKRRKN